MRKNIVRVAACVSFLCVCAFSGCNLDPETPRIKASHLTNVPEENTIFLCTDGIDNDGDTLKDCADPGCQAKGSGGILLPGDTVCPGTITKNADGTTTWTPSENTVYTCSDGIDNDGNGYADCQDNSCKSLPVCCTRTGSENTDEACSDGIDNDCNGYVDCADNNCKKLPVCCVPTGDENTLDACSDGIDNDCDGYIDCADHSCSGSGKSYDSQATDEAIALCQGTPENTEDACQDGKDNDRNGMIDCADEGCAEFDFCADFNFCADGVDNNFNGLIDCDDPECSDNSYCEGYYGTKEPPARPANFDDLSTEEKKVIYAQEYEYCNDGVDNNRNGLIDCHEYQCHMLSIKWEDYLVKNPDGELKPYAFSCQD